MGEDTHHQKPCEITVDHDHQTLLPPCDEVDHDTPIEYRLIGAYHYDTCMHLCPYTPHRRSRGVDRGQPLTDPSPGTIPRICSPFPLLDDEFPTSLQIRPRGIFFFVQRLKIQILLHGLDYTDINICRIIFTVVTVVTDPLKPW